MSVGAAAFRLRKEKGLTQAEVGRRAGLAVSYVSRIENGRIQPTVRTIRRLAAALGVPVSDLFPGTGSTEHRCPVSASGRCIGEQIRSAHGRPPGRRKARYGTEELRLLKITDYLVLHGPKEVRRALAVVLDALLERVPGR